MSADRRLASHRRSNVFDDLEDASDVHRIDVCRCGFDMHVDVCGADMTHDTHVAIQYVDALTLRPVCGDWSKQVDDESAPCGCSSAGSR